MAPAMMVLSVIAILYGGIICLAQTDQAAHRLQFRKARSS